MGVGQIEERTWRECIDEHRPRLCAWSPLIVGMKFNATRDTNQNSNASVTQNLATESDALENDHACMHGRLCAVSRLRDSALITLARMFEIIERAASICSAYM